ncbi:MAG: UxaA family hydrolase [Cloacibacillus porcorum]|nr:UxaA family hydrolase [Cloacibacillus porcorum]
MIYDLRDRNSYNVWNGRGGIADILSAALISPMLQRDAAARDYKYQSRLAAEAAQRQAESEASKRSAYDAYTADLSDAFSGMGYNPATGRALGRLIQLGANVKDAERYILPQTESYNTGKEIVTRKVGPYDNASIGDDYKLGVSMSPYQEAQSALTRDQFGLTKEQAAFERDYKNRSLAQDGWYKRGMLENAGQDNVHPSQLMPMGDGAYYWVDSRSKNITPSGFKVPSQSQKVDYETMLKFINAVGKGDGFTDPGGTGGSGGNPSTGLLEDLLAKAFIDQLTPRSDVPFKGYTPLYPGPGENLNSYQKKLNMDPRLAAFMESTGMTEAQARGYLANRVPADGQVKR